MYNLSREPDAEKSIKESLKKLRFLKYEIEQLIKKKTSERIKYNSFTLNNPSRLVIDLNNINFRLELNKNVVQNSNTSLMLWKVDELISYISKYFTLKIGDIIFTGTPSGVGKVSVGDELVGYLEEKKLFNLKVK